jgi:pheromone shutdown protein TraB
MDRSRINFLVALLSKSAPKQKKILVDLRDERIFKELWSLKAKNIVAVVNQWHMEGVETHWRRITGT